MIFHFSCLGYSRANSGLLLDRDTRKQILEAYGQSTHTMSDNEIRMALAAFLGLDTRTGH